MDHVARVRRLQSALPEAKLDLLLITHLPNLRYLCGFTGSAGALLVCRDGAVLFTDGRYKTQAREEVRNARIVIGKQSAVLAAAERVAVSDHDTKRGGRGLPALGIEGEWMSAGMRDRVASALRGKARVRSAPPLVERARMVKDAEEVRLIRNAVELGASLFAVARQTIEPGVSELALADRATLANMAPEYGATCGIFPVEYEARSQGAEGMSFPTIIASGERSAMIHGRASEARIPRRGFVVCDFGIILAGYCSDRTRTVHVGRASSEAREFYGAVLAAQQAAIAAVRPGVTASEVDAAARNVLRRRKLARYFTHSTGHGLGLEIHEAPRVADGQAQTLEAGMVITIEPGAYVAGQWGVRIEDVVVVTASGCEVLTPADKQLVVI